MKSAKHRQKVKTCGKQGLRDGGVRKRENPGPRINAETTEPTKMTF